MKTAAAIPNCPSDGCPLKPFATVKAPQGYTLVLNGCRYCAFDCVIVVATDASGRTRPVSQWSAEPESGLYVLVQEFGRTPPGWHELTCAALPQRNPT